MPALRFFPASISWFLLLAGKMPALRFFLLVFVRGIRVRAATPQE
ncbi:hypothetical protein [Egbenema bharatensis]